MTALRTRTEDRGLVDQAAEAFQAFRDGDLDRMGDLVDLLTPILWHAARSRGADTATAEDVLQAAWLALVDKADTVRDPRAVLAWLLTTVRRDAGRRLASRGRQVLVLDDATDDLPDEEERPDELVVLDDRQALLWSHVGQLGERCQHLLRVIAFAARPDYATISEALDMPVGSIGPTRSRCLDKLRRSLEDDDRWEGYDR